MTIAIVGASGFLGIHLIDHLLASSDHRVHAIARDTSLIQIPPELSQRVSTFDVDVFDERALTDALKDVDVVYYFIHMMGQKNKDFVTLETNAAHIFSNAVVNSQIPRVIYMGGLGNDKENLSDHLSSRHHTGEIMRKFCPLVIELRASMIIGKGSIAFDIIKNLVHALPLMTLPRWAITKTQPIALKDAIEYLTQSATVSVSTHEIVEIGGPHSLSYQELYKLYANWSGRNPLMVTLPFLPEWLGGWWLDLFTPPKHAKVGRVMVHSMSNAMVVTNDRAQQLFPDIRPRSLQQAFDELKE